MGVGFLFFGLLFLFLFFQWGEGIVFYKVIGPMKMTLLLVEVIIALSADT